MNTLNAAIVATLTGVAGLSMWAEARAADDIIVFRGDTFAAIAFSEETGNWGYAHDQPSRYIAEILARRYCEAKDAKVVGWVHNGFCALALGDDGAWGTGFASGDGATNTDAKREALAECRKHGKNARLVLCIASVDVKQELFDDPDE